MSLAQLQPQLVLLFKDFSLKFNLFGYFWSQGDQKGNEKYSLPSFKGSWAHIKNFLEIKKHGKDYWVWFLGSRKKYWSGVELTKKCKKLDHFKVNPINFL